MVIRAKMTDGQVNIGDDNIDLYKYDLSYRGKEMDDIEEER